jgi:hypothetical protein
MLATAPDKMTSPLTNPADGCHDPSSSIIGVRHCNDLVYFQDLSPDLLFLAPQRMYLTSWCSWIG